MLFRSACVMLRTASRNSYIHDDDEILEEFDLDRLRSRFMENLNYEEKINSNCDILIKGIGFIKVKGDTNFFINISKDRYEIRPSIVGGNYE